MHFRYALPALLLCGGLSLFAAAAPVPDEKAVPRLPDNKTIDTFQCSLGTAALGPVTTFSVTRAGKVHYSYASQPHTGSGGKVVQKEWDIPEKEALVLLNGLVEDGLLALEEDAGNKFPRYSFTVTYGRWQLSARPKGFGEPLMKRLQPYLEQADPEQWKKGQ